MARAQRIASHPLCRRQTRQQQQQWPQQQQQPLGVLHARRADAPSSAPVRPWSAHGFDHHTLRAYRRAQSLGFCPGRGVTIAPRCRCTRPPPARRRPVLACARRGAELTPSFARGMRGRGAAHNVYAQLVGSKRFVLIAPDESTNLYVYPRLHPSTRQSQVDLRAVPADCFHRFHTRLRSWEHRAKVANATQSRAETSRERRLRHAMEHATRCFPACEVILTPGDVLFIPPYWWHRVSTIGYAAALRARLLRRGRCVLILMRSGWLANPSHALIRRSLLSGRRAPSRWRATRGRWR